MHSSKVGLLKGNSKVVRNLGQSPLLLKVKLPLDPLLDSNYSSIPTFKFLYSRNKPVFRSASVEGVVAQWCYPLVLKPEQSGGVTSISGRTPPLRHDKGSRTRLGLLYFCDPSAWR